MPQTVSQDVGLIGVGTDHAGVRLKDEVLAHLREQGVRARNFGTDTEEPCDYPEVAIRLGEAVVDREVDRGVLVCGTGIGMSVAANKVRGVRAALCTTVASARLARTHNDANVLVLPGRDGAVDDPLHIVDTWLRTPFSGAERHVRRLAYITAYDESRGRGRAP